MARSKPTHAQSDALDRRWHLARTPLEIEVTELEYALMRSFEAFGRWQAECLANVVDFAASGPENALLHIIRMNDRPKSIHDLAHMANREDIPNIQYSLRKLIKGDLSCVTVAAGPACPMRRRRSGGRSPADTLMSAPCC